MAFFVDETKLDSSYPDAQFQRNDYQFPPFRRDRNKYEDGKIVFIRQGLSQEGYRNLKLKSLRQCVLSWLFLKRSDVYSLHIDLLKITTLKPFSRK